MIIGSAIMVRNMAALIAACVHSLSWTDGIYLFDDGSTDGSAEIAAQYARNKIVIERSKSKVSAFITGEYRIRNRVIDRAFSALNCDVLIVIDADELISASIRPFIEEMWNGKEYDNISLTMWHLYDKKSYLHFWETHFNGVYMIDPHTRVIRKHQYFQQLYEDGSHPALIADERTLCLHGSYHFHLKYYKYSPYPNFSLDFLPTRLCDEVVQPYRRELPFVLPADIEDGIDLIPWYNLTPVDMPYIPHRKVN